MGARHLQERPERRERQRSGLDRRRERQRRLELRRPDGDLMPPPTSRTRRTPTRTSACTGRRREGLRSRPRQGRPRRPRRRLRRRGRLPGRPPERRDQPARDRHRQERPERRERRTLRSRPPAGTSPPARAAATQNATSEATTNVSNNVHDAPEPVAPRPGGKNVGGSQDCHDGLSAGCGGAGGFQARHPERRDEPGERSASRSANRTPSTANAPVSTAGGNIYLRPELRDPDRRRPTPPPTSATRPRRIRTRASSRTSAARTAVWSTARTAGEEARPRRSLRRFRRGRRGLSYGAQLAVDRTSWPPAPRSATRTRCNSNTPSSTAGWNIYARPEHGHSERRRRPPTPTSPTARRRIRTSGSASSCPCSRI